MPMIKIKEKGDVAIVSFDDDVIRLTVSTFQEVSLSDLVSKKTDKVKIVIDLGNIEYLDSTAIGKIIGIYRGIHDKNGALAFINVNEVIADTINMLTVNKIVRSFDSEEEAVKELSS